ncbi:MAG: peptidoglycan-binding protein LysM, partial [gamma proteobacterium symbiont of Ctena orbiculata]
MGLFDFAANLGKKLFGKDDDPAEKIKQQIEADNPGIKDLDVSFEDGKVVLSGNADSADAL